jgi:hypothetical protein
MARLTGAQIAQLARQRAQQAKAEQKALNAEMNKAKQARNQIEKERDDAWTALAAALVPTLDVAVLDARAKQLGLPAIASAPVKQQYDAFVARHQQAKAQLDVDPLFVRREELENEAQIKLAELGDAIAPLKQSVEALEGEPYFAELVRVGYGTDGYTGRFWQLSYYRHWKNGDAVVEKHGARLKCTKFGEIRTKYLAEHDALKALLDEQRGIARQRKAVAERAAAHGETIAALREAPERVLAQVHGVMKAHLSPIEPNDLAKVFAGDPSMDLALKRVVGTAKKREYLDAMDKQWLSAPFTDLGNAVDKYSHTEQKYSRQKNWSRAFDVDVDRMFPDKSQSWWKRRQRWSTGYDRMMAFDAYDRAYLRDDYLWWDLYMGRDFDGSFIPEVSRLRSSNDYLRYELDQERASAAVANAQLDRDERMLSGDVS